VQLNQDVTKVKKQAGFACLFFYITIMAKLDIQSEEQLGILLWNKCNAKCKHCSQDSSPISEEIIPNEKIISLIEEAGEIYNSNWCFSASGGEVFLHYDKLLEYIKLVKNKQGYTTLVSNCFWATDVSKTEEMLKPLIENNLRVLAISYDVYHRDFIPIQNIKNVISVAKKNGLQISFKTVASKTSRLSKIIEEIEDTNPWFVRFVEMPLVPSGRASLFSEDEFIYSVDIPDLPCPAASLTINSKGKAMACCNGAGIFKYLQVGDIFIDSLTEIEYKFASDQLINFLRNKGPYGCLKFINETDRHFVLNKKYVNVCHLCIDLFSNELLADKIVKGIDDYFLLIKNKEFIEIMPAPNRVDCR